MLYEKAMNSQIMIKIMRRLIRSTDRKGYLILDNLCSHHSKPVKEWLDRHAEKIEVFSLPTPPSGLSRFPIQKVRGNQAIISYRYNCLDIAFLAFPRT